MSRKKSSPLLRAQVDLETCERNWQMALTRAESGKIDITDITSNMDILNRSECRYLNEKHIEEASKIANTHREPKNIEDNEIELNRQYGIKLFNQLYKEIKIISYGL